MAPSDVAAPVDRSTVKSCDPVTTSSSTGGVSTVSIRWTVALASWMSAHTTVAAPLTTMASPSRVNDSSPPNEGTAPTVARSLAARRCSSTTCRASSAVS